MTQLCVAASVSMLIYYNSVRRRHHLTRSGILAPNHSPWRHLYENGDEGSFLNLTVRHLKKCMTICIQMNRKGMVRAVQDCSIVTMNWVSSCFIWVHPWNYQSFVSFLVTLLLVAVSLSTFNYKIYRGVYGLWEGTNVNMSRSTHFYWFSGPVDAPIGQI